MIAEHLTPIPGTDWPVRRDTRLRQDAWATAGQGRRFCSELRRHAVDPEEVSG